MAKPQSTAERHGHQPRCFCSPSVHNSPTRHFSINHNPPPRPLKELFLRYANTISTRDRVLGGRKPTENGSEVPCRPSSICSPRARPVVVKTTRLMVPAFNHVLRVAFPPLAGHCSSRHGVRGAMQTSRNPLQFSVPPQSGVAGSPANLAALNFIGFIREV